jgi:ribosomal protein S18 acetylase RimI-like enzyme
VLKNINVEERGRGFGNRLMSEFLDKASEHGAETVLLVADKSEEQAEGFDLVRWYEGFGFRILKQTAVGPLMITEE